MSQLEHRKALDDIVNYTAAKSLNQIKQELGINDIIRLAANENIFGVSPKVKEAVIKSVESIFLYPDGNCSALKRKIAEKYDVSEDNIVFGNGSFELLSLAAQAYLNPEEESIIPEPSFNWYKVVTKSMNAISVIIPLKDYKIDLESIKNKITAKTKIIWICNPNNPTGTFINKNELLLLLESIPKNILVILDEAYYEFVTDKEYPETTELLSEYKNILILRTFSKVYGLAGLRVGYGIGDKKIISNLNKIRTPINVNMLAQIAAEASLSDNKFKKKCLKSNKKEKLYYYKKFEGLNLEYIPTETNFIMVNLKIDSSFVVNEILKKGISVRAGIEFGMPTWLRITIGRREENEKIINVIKEVLRRGV